MYFEETSYIQLYAGCTCLHLTATFNILLLFYWSIVALLLTQTLLNVWDHNSFIRSISAKIPRYLPFCCVSKQSRNTLRILNALVCSYPSGRTLIKSMCVGLFSICLYACLSCRVTIFLSGRELFCNSHRACFALYLLPSTKTFLSLYLSFTAQL